MLRLYTSGCRSTVEPRCLLTTRAGWNRRSSSSLAAVSRHNDVVIVGGGAAGLTAAYFAAENGAKVSFPAGCLDAARQGSSSEAVQCRMIYTLLRCSLSHPKDMFPLAVYMCAASLVWHAAHALDWQIEWGLLMSALFP
jgi:hypothetical protein